MSCLNNLLKKFYRDEGGNFAIIGGLMLVPILATMGAAVDYSQAYGTKSKLQASADTATLAAARDAQSINQFYDLTRAYLAANSPELNLEITPKTGPNSVEVNVKYRYQTTFLAMAGINEIPVEVETEVAIRKFNRARIQPGGSNNGSRQSGGTSSQEIRDIVKRLEAVRDEMLRSARDLSPRHRERARKQIREQFARLIKKAKKGEFSGSADPIYIKR